MKRERQTTALDPETAYVALVYSQTDREVGKAVVVRLISSSSTAYARGTRTTSIETIAEEDEPGIHTSGANSSAIVVGVVGDANPAMDCLKMWCE